MAMKLPGFLTRTDTKSRLILVASTIGVIFLLVFLGSKYMGGAKTTGAANVANAPTGLQSVPGSQLTPEYYRALAQANAQSAKQAQMSGGSAVPTMMNVPGQQASPSFGQSNCTVMCPGSEQADVKDDVNDLVKGGNITQDQANRLLDMAKNNVPISQYTDALDSLVRSGKITPEQARKLLETYKKQHENALLTDSAQTMDDLIKSGKLPLGTGTQLLALQKQNVTPAQYAAELNRLVKEGKITPDTASVLLGQYTQQQGREATKDNAYQLAKMARAGQITQDVAQDLTDLQKKNVPVTQYAAELSRLVSAGKMTPATASQLLQQYQQQRATGGPSDQLNSIIAAQQAECAGNLNNLVAQGKLTQEAANGISDLMRKWVSPQEFYAALNQLAQSNKINPTTAQSIMGCYQKLTDVQAEAKKLQDLQGNNATIQAYADELKTAVTSGAISPDAAAQLLQQYQAMVTPVAPPGGVLAATEANIPGAEDFARLQQRLQKAQQPTQGPALPTAENTQQFTNAIEQQEADEEARRQQHIQDLMTGMSGQAQSLINSWSPPAMQHRAGSLAESNSGGKSGGSASASSSNSSRTTTTVVETTGAPLIKAGTIMFAILDTAVNSDYPDTPVMATIIAGKYKGARVLGKLSLAQGMDRVSLNFNLMDMEDWAKTKSITAFAIDPDTARTVLATNVDYHYLLRYGSIIGTSFLTGYANSITNAGTSATTLTGMTSTHPNLSPASKIAVGLGQVGTTLGSAVSSYVNTPNTVTVNAGVGIGILFMADVS